MGRSLIAALVLATTASAQSDAQRLERLDQSLNEVLEMRYEQTGGRSLAESARIDYGVYTILSTIASDRLDRTTRQLAQVDSRFWFRGDYQGSTVYARLRLHYRATAATAAAATATTSANLS